MKFMVVSNIDIETFTIFYLESWHGGGFSNIYFTIFSSSNLQVSGGELAGGG